MTDSAPRGDGPAPRRERGRWIARFNSGQWLGVSAGGLVLAALVGLAVCLGALKNLSDARATLVDRVDPARVAAGSLLTALVDEQTGVRAYALSAQPQFLSSYAEGRRAEQRARGQLAAAARSGALGSELSADLREFEAEIHRWRMDSVEPAVARTRRAGHPVLDAAADARLQGGFAQVRAAFGSFDAHLAARREHERAQLQDAATAATIAVLFAVGLLLAAALVGSVTLRRVVARPLARLARDARRVAGGDFEHAVRTQGPREVVALSTDVESMRRRILDDLREVTEARTQLEEQAIELRRSNAELEQFAYVASHDLQEPLRKVASFCGLLQQRYQGQLDERADQYIEYAVDGAKRMQALINDLLAFSRVGRAAGDRALVEMEEIALEAIGNLGHAIEDAGAKVELDGPLPAVRGDRSLLVALLQNLIGNAVKFRGDQVPRVRLSARQEGDAYIFAVDDNGIGIEPRHADRIFVIFQRLHAKDEFDGTGIGLALCRKIAEWHGGEIWLEPQGALGGASFRFTLPVPPSRLAGEAPIAQLDRASPS